MAAPAVATEIINTISEFNFERVSDEWTKYVWDSNFTDAQQLSDDVREEIMDAESLPRLLSNCKCLEKLHIC